MVAGFLKSNRGLFRLGPKITTVGREGCDLVIQSADVDQQHSLIEYSDTQRCFVLQDLNTANGTYVNDCRVQNAAVRLAPGDVVRFGLTSLPYELVVEFPGDQVARAIDTSQPNLWQTQQNMQPFGSMVGGPVSSSYTQLNQVQASPPSQPRPAWQTMNVPKALPQPTQTLRSRPLSAETLLQRQKESPPILQPGHRFSSQPNSETGKGSDDQSGASSGAQTHRIQSPSNPNLEQELARRDAIVNQFRDEINELKQRLQNVLTATAGGQVDLVQRYCQLESELSSKALEATCLREQVTRLRLQGEGPVHYKQELSERVQELQSLKAELERVKKDKNITAGLLSQVQKDLSGKDTSISRLTREIENLKRELREKDVQLSSLGSKFQKMKELKSLEEEREAREKELISLREQFKLAENRLAQQFDEIAALKAELDKHKKEATLLRESEKKAVKDMEKFKEQVTESQRLETQTRADLRAVEAKLERLRSRTVQLLSTSGTWAAVNAGPISDEALIDQLVKVIDAEADARRQVKTASEEGMRAGARKERDAIGSAVGKFAKTAGESEDRLAKSRRSVKELQAEYDVIQAFSPDDDVVLPVKRVLLDALNNQLTRARLNVRSLMEIGVITEENSDLIDAINKRLEVNAQRIADLESQLQANQARLADSVNAVSSQHRDELEQLREKHAVELKEAAQAARDECERHYQSIVEQLNVELNKHDATSQTRISSLTELVETQGREIGALKEDLRNKSAEFDRELANAVEQAKLAGANLASELEVALRSQIAELGDALQAERADKEKRDSQSGQDLEGYKEQIRQHAVTISAMEDKIGKLTKKNKEYGTEVDRLNKELGEWKSKAEKPRPSSPVRRKPDPALEEALSAIKRENIDLRQQIAEQQQKISSLQRDLSGAAARLSDMTGELSEGQKLEMERCKQLAEKRGADLETTREQLAKLSAIVDKLKADSEALRNENRTLKHTAEKASRDCCERDKIVHDLRDQLAATQDKMRQHIEKIEDEGKNRGDLVQLGMQCRGERHEQIIIRQREALAELRTRIRMLEQNKLPIIPTTDAAFHQIQMLKKEVADLRTSQAITDTQLQDDAMQTGDAIVNAQRMMANYEAQLEAERTATRELRRTLEKSEFTYSELVSGAACNLELEIVGNRTIADLPPDEQDKICRQRRDMVEAIVTRVKHLRDKVVRKDELLKNYEIDLAKISQLKELTSKKDEQIKQLLREMRGKIEENEFLRENLDRTKSRFEQEKRLNSAVKSKKTFHLENDPYYVHSYPKHSCTTPDPRVKAEQKKRVDNDKVKKKQYEVAALKVELDERQRQLDETTLRLHQLQAGLGPVGPNGLMQDDDDLPLSPAGDLTP